MHDSVQARGGRLFVPPSPAGSMPARLKALASRRALRQALADVASWPDYHPTPTFDLPGLARRHGVAQILCKWEGARFDVASFKPLGPGYALVQHLRRRLAAEGIAARSAEVLAGRYKEHFAGLTACAATSGNHGRALAWAASKAGIDCSIYVARAVSSHRREAIARFGARIVPVDGDYDDAAGAAARSGAIVVAGRAEGGDPAIATDLVIGYSVLAQEAITQCPAAPTHVFVAGGSGRLASGTLAAYWHEYGARRPHLVVVEPLESACLMESAEHGHPVEASGSGRTMMDGLVVARPAPLAWALLQHGAHAFLSIEDAVAAPEVAIAARGCNGDPGIAIGETGIAAWAGFTFASRSPALGHELGLSADSRVLIVACEGATDPHLHRRLTAGELANPVK
jgi:diaminopropionate ammonia-lyase